MTARKTITLFVLMALAGLLLLFLPGGLHREFGIELPETARTLIAEIATALLVSTFIGGVFEWWFRQQALEDVVRAALGYLLPDSVRGEMTWISGLSLIRTNYRHKFVIEPIDAEIVRLEESIHYDIENKSNHSQTVTPQRSIDERHYQIERARIIAAGFSRESRVKEYTKEELKTVTVDTGWSLTFSYDEVTLKPGQKVTVWSETIQIRRCSDRETLVMDNPVERPEFEIVIPDVLQYDLSSLHRERLAMIAPSNYRLDGTLLPSQGISLRWWPRKS